MSDATIFLISLAVTALGLAISWQVTRRRGAASGMRGAAWSLVPVAAALTGVTGFFVDLAFDPGRWAGVAVAGLAALLYVTSGVMLARREGAAPAKADKGGKAAKGGRSGKGAGSGAPKASKGGGEPKGVEAPGRDPEMAEIEEILRNRGIS